jgi:3-deoxy-manno-octulosonate cytidylyltransferase (CMP-KDO synthetase)
MEEAEEILDPNIVKVVFNAEGFALYFSRSPIPYHRDIFQKTEDRRQRTDFLNLSSDSLSSVFCFKHIGIYAYRREVLLKLSKMPSTRLETIEKLEQLRALENGLKIKVKETLFDTIGVDTPADIERVEKCLSTSL